VAFVLTYGLLNMVPNQYEAAAEIYVNRLGYQPADPPNPSTVATIAKSDEVLLLVRTEFLAKYKVKAPEFERFVRQFTVKSEVLQDTAVKKDVSPVLVLSVRSEGTEQTQFLMQSWTQAIVKMFGNFASEEARSKLASLQDQAAKLEREIQAAETEKARYYAELPLQEKLFAETMDLLAPARFIAPADPFASVPGAPQQVNLQVERSQPPPGLLAQRARLQIQLERVRAGAAGTSAPKELEAEVRALDSVIAATRKDLAELQQKVQDVRVRFDAASRRASVLTETQRSLSKEMDNFIRAAAFYRDFKPGAPPAGGDLRVLSQPVKPELKVWPKRTTFAGIAAVIVALFAMVAILTRNYLAEAARVSLDKRPAPTNS
jgi:uncharacterized protein involved in exopolysaccharide biosynthesis